MKCRYVDENPEVGKCSRAQIHTAKVSFKNTYSVVRALRGMKVVEAREYCDQVLAKKRCIPMRRFNENCGRTKQAREFGTDKGRWPEKSIKWAQKLITKAESNAKAQQLEDTENMVIYQFHVNRATGTRRREYGAHGRIKPKCSKPCHMQIILAPEQHRVRKARGKSQWDSKTMHRRVIMTGGGHFADQVLPCAKDIRAEIAASMAARKAAKN